MTEDRNPTAYNRVSADASSRVNRLPDVFQDGMERSLGQAERREALGKGVFEPEEGG
jgi:hypothetical protein